MEKGYVQVYTGNGKGKTTASLGVVMRAVSAGLKVYIGQFLKDQEYNELKTLKNRFPEVTVEQYGSGLGCFVRNTPDAAEFDAAREGYEKAKKALVSGKYDLVIMDEINIAVVFNLLSVNQVLDLIKEKPNCTELIITGRYASQEVRDAADLVSEITEEKHYYTQGVLSRPGIEC